MKGYNLIVVGTGFSSSHFLLKYLKKFPTHQILVLDRGISRSHAEMMQKGDWTEAKLKDVVVDRSVNKAWALKPSFGGNSNYWIGNTPRFLPSDFETYTKYGVGSDWPLNYSDLEIYYGEAENAIKIAGAEDIGRISPRSSTYPLPPHEMSLPDKLLKKAYPDSFFAMPCARASQATQARAKCCATSECMYCPIDAKFRVNNELSQLYKHENIEVLLEAEVRSLVLGSDAVTGLEYYRDGQQNKVAADCVVLGANPVFNCSILLRSGDDSPKLGKGLMDHPTYFATVLLDGVENFQGGTRETGVSYFHYDGPHRAEMAGCLVTTSNVPNLRPEFGRWRESLRLEIAFEDLPQDQNYIDLDPETGMARVNYKSHSEYTQKGRNSFEKKLEKYLSAALPVEEIYMDDTPTPAGAAHIMGTHRMGNDPASSVVDKNSVHHKYRNLILLGGGNFVTPSAVNPTLTMSALALRSADFL